MSARISSVGCPGARGLALQIEAEDVVPRGEERVLLAVGHVGGGDQLVHDHHGGGEIQVGRERLAEPRVEPLRGVAELGRGRRPGGHAPPELRDAAVGILHGLPREVHLAAVARLEREPPERERIQAPLDELRDAHHVPRGLRDLLAGQTEVAAVHPDGDDLVSNGTFRLRDLVFVVREAQVVPARVDVEAIAQVLHGHRRAFDVPAGEPLAPRARPFHQAAGAGGLPEGEIGGVPLARIGLEVAMPLAEVVQRVPR